MEGNVHQVGPTWVSLGGAHLPGTHLMNIGFPSGSPDVLMHGQQENPMRHWPVLA